jgi:shikimate kinase
MGEGGDRPLARRWEELLRARLPLYRRASLTVPVDGATADAVARRVAALLEGGA